MLLHFIVVCRISLQISDAQLPYLEVWTGEIEVKYMDRCSILILFFFSHYVVEFCCCGLHHCFGQTCHADGFTFDLEYFGIKRSTITARCQSPVAAKQTKLISPPPPWMTAGIGVVLIICAVCIMARFPHCSKNLAVCSDRTWTLSYWHANWGSWV